MAELELKQHRDHLEELVEARTLELGEANAELEQALDSLTEINAELEDATAAKSQFLANMSHELRTPLNSIIGFAGMLAGGMVGPLTDEQTLQAGMIQKSGKQLLELVNDILDLSRIEAGATDIRPLPLDPVEVVMDVADAVRPLAAEKGLELHAETPGKSMVVVTDKEKLRQILTNIVGNAIKFTTVGEVSIEVKIRDDARIAFIVSDTGPGIPPATSSTSVDCFTGERDPWTPQPGTGRVWRLSGLGASAWRRNLRDHRRRPGLDFHAAATRVTRSR